MVYLQFYRHFVPYQILSILLLLLAILRVHSLFLQCRISVLFSVLSVLTRRFCRECCTHTKPASMSPCKQQPSLLVLIFPLDYPGARYPKCFIIHSIFDFINFWWLGAQPLYGEHLVGNANDVLRSTMCMLNGGSRVIWRELK